MNPFIFFKAQGGSFKESDWAGKKIFKEELKQIWNYVTELEAAETENVLRHSESSLNVAQLLQ